MTRNQISYWELQEKKRANTETERSNRAREAETHRSNLVYEHLEDAKVKETIRHNYVNESQVWASQQETSRHNKEQERYNFTALAETTRHNMAAEELQMYQVLDAEKKTAEQKRHNLATETQAKLDYYEKRSANLRESVYKYDKLEQDYIGMQYQAVAGGVFQNAMKAIVNVFK